MSDRQATLLPPPVESEPLFDVLFFGVDPEVDPESDLEPEPLLAAVLDPDPESEAVDDPESDVVDAEPAESSEELDESLDDPALALDDRLSFL
ncbi:MAG TPA: hypothetical protein VHV79_05230 [Mycobacteriales bacterium]|nr:hypothetical protein [Mycobacteriales bacterium]